MKKALSTIAYYTPVKHGLSEQIYYVCERIIITDRNGAHDFKGLLKEYSNHFDLMKDVYLKAKYNGYKITYNEDFNTLWYDIILMSENGYVAKYPVSKHLQSIFENKG